jgi:DNA-binding NarL/FixJ family response regulator
MVIDNKPEPTDGADNPRLSPRHREVVDLVAKGLSNKEIAGELGLSRRTVSTHLERLYRRHGFHSRVEVIRLLSNR